MSQAKRDQNHITVAMGASTADNTPLPLLVDPTTDLLLVSIIVVADNPLVPGTYTDNAKRDPNHVHVGLGYSGSANTLNGEPRSLITAADVAKQYLFCDVLILP